MVYTRSWRACDSTDCRTSDSILGGSLELLVQSCSLYSSTFLHDSWLHIDCQAHFQVNLSSHQLRIRWISEFESLGFSYNHAWPHSATLVRRLRSLWTNTRAFRVDSSSWKNELRISSQAMCLIRQTSILHWSSLLLIHAAFWVLLSVECVTL